MAPLLVTSQTEFALDFHLDPHPGKHIAILEAFSDTQGI
jgi:hypothetical protein